MDKKQVDSYDRAKTLLATLLRSQPRSLKIKQQASISGQRLTELGNTNMIISTTFIRFFFVLLSSLLFSLYIASHAFISEIPVLNWLIGALLGLAIGFIGIFAENILKRTNLKTWLVLVFGLSIGYFFAQAILLVVDTAVAPHSLAVSENSIGLIRLTVYMLSIFGSILLTVQAAQEFYFALPFVRFQSKMEKRRDILLDQSILLDPRVIDLCASGLFDHQLVLPRFVIKDLNYQLESSDEQNRFKARKALEVIKKLESNATLDLKFNETDFSDTKEITAKLVRLARTLDANILTADLNRIQQASIEGVRIFNIHALSNALKPLTQTGEVLSIKVQRYGKEPRQGIGYLDDGTMVVINGGAEYIGETIKTQVLSVKHTSSGRMIFCNAWTDEETSENGHATDRYSVTISEMEAQHKSYFTL